jgi:hypothetical protein
VPFGVNVILKNEVILSFALFMSDLQVAAFETALKDKRLILQGPGKVVRSHWGCLLGEVPELSPLFLHTVVFFELGTHLLLDQGKR